MSIFIGSSQLSTRSFDSSGTSNFTLVLDGSTAEKAAPSANYLKFNAGITTNGIYWLNPGGLGANQFYLNFDFDSTRVWTMVIANRINTSGMSNLTFANATGAVVNSRGTYDANLNFNLWVGLNYWPYLGNTINQYVSTSATGLSGSHTKRSRWKYSGWASNYSFLYPRSIVNDVGGSTPGWYSYHAVNQFSLSTFDNANGNTCGCSAQYINNPFWYGCCWSGNYFAGGGYADAPYWDGSGGDYHNYGAAFLAFTDI
jgi:hypothetical protein